MNWSSELSLEGIAGSNNGAGYIDRMMGGGDPSQRQMMGIGSKRSQCNQQKKNNKPKQPNNSDRKPFQSQAPVVNIDNVAWLAERRRKYPKIGGESSSNTTTMPGSQDHATSESVVVPDTSITSGPQPSGSKIKKSKPKKISNYEPPKRKKTLFEMLIEMDQQSN